MELEFKCIYPGCDFKGSVDWPEYKIESDNPGLQGVMEGVSSITKHHIKTRPKASKENLFLGAGHGKFTTRIKGNEIKVEVAGTFARVSEGFEFLTE
jgi:hypothetical protein